MLISRVLTNAHTMCKNIISVTCSRTWTGVQVKQEFQRLAKASSKARLHATHDACHESWCFVNTCTPKAVP